MSNFSRKFNRKNKPNKSEDITMPEALDYLFHQDLKKFLGLGDVEGAFGCIFHEDCTAMILPPSPKCDQWRYFCEHDGEPRELNIIELTMKLSDRNFETCLEYLGDIFGIKFEGLKYSTYKREHFTDKEEEEEE